MSIATLRSLPVLTASAVGIVVVMISGYFANYHDGHDNIVLGVAFLLCNAIAFWQTRNLGWRCVFTVGAVTATLLLASMSTSFPKFSPVEQRLRVTNGFIAVFQIIQPMIIPFASLTVLGMLLASLARYAFKRRIVGVGASLLAVVALVGGMIAVAPRSGQTSVILPAPYPSLGMSHEVFEQFTEAVPPEWKLDHSDELGKPEMSEWRDVAYGPHGKSNQLDLFRPSTVKTPVPLVIFIHGGGWLSESKETEGFLEPWANAMLRNGIAVAPINYRLAPYMNQADDPTRALFPAQVQDCFSAVRFLRANAAEYNLDPNNIAVMGHSAGAHLAGLVGLAGDVAEFNNDGWNLGINNRVKAAVVLAGPTDLRISEEQFYDFIKSLNVPTWAPGENPDFDLARTISPVTCLIGGRVKDKLELAIKASPVSHVSIDDPPVFLMNGFRDTAVPPHQAELLHCKLRAAGVESELHIVPGAGHGLAAHRGTATLIIQFLRKHLQ